MASFKEFMHKNGSNIMFGAGVVGTVSAGVLAVIETKKYLVDRNFQIEQSDDGKLTRKQELKLIGRYYGLPLAIETLSVASLICGKVQDNKSIKTLGSVCVASENALTAYKTITDKVLTEEQKDAVKEQIDQKKIDETPLPNDVHPDEGETLYFEPYSGRYLCATENEVMTALTKLRDQIQKHDYATLNDWYELLKLDRCETGDYFLWSSERRLVDISFDAYLKDTKTPCVMIKMFPNPSFG